MPKYIVKGAQTELVHEGVVYREGDEIEMSVNAALEFRHQLIPVDASGGFPIEPAEFRGLRDHEKLGILQERKKKLEAEITKIDADIAKLTGEQ